jgi:glycosyltransferase involved in cell wall biosynthesis
VSAVSPWLADTAAKYHSLAKFIPDSVPDKWYSVKNKINKNSPLTLLYCGKSEKADMLCDWWEVAKNKGCRLLFFSDSAENMPDGAEFIQWKYSAVKNVFQKADVGLAPRGGLDNPYNFSHSSFKVESIMLAGIPVIASPVRSYLNVLGGNEGGGLVDGVGEFEDLLERFINDREYLESVSQAAVKKAAPHMQRRGAEIWNRFIRSVLLINNRYG